MIMVVIITIQSVLGSQQLLAAAAAASDEAVSVLIKIPENILEPF